MEWERLTSGTQVYHFGTPGRRSPAQCLACTWHSSDVCECANEQMKCLMKMNTLCASSELRLGRFIMTSFEIT